MEQTPKRNTEIFNKPASERVFCIMSLSSDLNHVTQKSILSMLTRAVDLLLLFFPLNLHIFSSFVELLLPIFYCGHSNLINKTETVVDILTFLILLQKKNCK